MMPFGMVGGFHETSTDEELAFTTVTSDGASSGTVRREYTHA